MQKSRRHSHAGRIESTKAPKNHSSEAANYSRKSRQRINLHAPDEMARERRASGAHGMCMSELAAHWLKSETIIISARGQSDYRLMACFIKTIMA